MNNDAEFTDREGHPLGTDGSPLPTLKASADPRCITCRGTGWHFLRNVEDCEKDICPCVDRRPGDCRICGYRVCDCAAEIARENEYLAREEQWEADERAGGLEYEAAMQLAGYR